MVRAHKSKLTGAVARIMFFPVMLRPAMACLRSQIESSIGGAVQTRLSSSVEALSHILGLPFLST